MNRQRRGAVARRIRASAVALALLAGSLGAAPSTASASSAGPPPVPSGVWERLTGPSTRPRSAFEIHADRYRTFTLDHPRLRRALAAAPPEFTLEAERRPLEVSLPAPGGGLQRFTVQESPVMEPALAARHPEIHTYSGRGIDDPTATVRLSLTPLGFRASVRGSDGAWYVDPLYRRDRSAYATYYGRDLDDVHGPFVERGPLASDEANRVDATATAAPPVGGQLRTYRLALVSDPSYADYFDPLGDQPANVTAAKVELVNRVTQIYEDETSIRLVLVAGNDVLNLDTDAEATGTNGPCGAARCFTTTQLDGCQTSLLTRNRIVVGQLIGASNYDIGHIILGKNGGGIAGLGVVGADRKAEGCTGLAAPVGDFFAVDYVAHEMGHQFDADHTFNGTQGNCAGGNRNGPTSVEPGSGSSIMAYAGICAGDNLQAHSDPYWSQRSLDQITAYVGASPGAINEVQTVSLRNFNEMDSFTLRYNGNDSAVIQRQTNYSAAAIKAAIEAIPGWPATATVAVSRWAGGTGVDDTGFRVTFGGSLQQTNVSSLELTNLTGGVSGFVGETAKGGAVDNQGDSVTPTGNAAPSVTTPSSYTIPYRTPFELAGSASDADADPLTYLWEQNDAGSAAVSLFTASKATGPLFRQFGTGQDASVYDPTEYESPGENHVTTDPARVFPDMSQILADNTNADTGDCPSGIAPQRIECYSEFLPTSVYPGPMHFRLTVRDGNPGAGGVNSANTTVHLAPGTGPFRVTSPNTAVSYPPGSSPTVTWDVAGTCGDAIGTTLVDILLSTNGGDSFEVLAAGTPNDGTETVVLPPGETTEARIMVRPVDNVFFDVSNTDFSISIGAPAPPPPAVAPTQCPAPPPPTAAAPEVAIADATVKEKDRVRPVRVPVRLSGPAAGQVSIGYATRKGTARPGKDFKRTAGTLTFAPGQTVAMVRVRIKGDTRQESAERFFVVLRDPGGATLRKGRGRVRIRDND